ncbi:MAG: AbrB/MazE/SpoVT family DNA-binding domain-containing protein [Alphaproteobacteria bacterium]|nr:AbrB/MazE/SpoVT family DNA-binding domain-containing protein [Alphaproteobacteria bacterium]
MADVRIAKLFKNGASQAVRLPADFRFDGTEVYAIRDEATGDVTLTTRPDRGSWDDFFALLETVDVPSDFLEDRPMNTVPEDSDPFREDA